MTVWQELQIKLPIAVLFYGGSIVTVSQSAFVGLAMVFAACFAYRKLRLYEGWGR